MSTTTPTFSVSLCHATPPILKPQASSLNRICHHPHDHRTGRSIWRPFQTSPPPLSCLSCASPTSLAPSTTSTTRPQIPCALFPLFWTRESSTMSRSIYPGLLAENRRGMRGERLYQGEPISCSATSFVPASDASLILYRSSTPLPSPSPSPSPSDLPARTPTDSRSSHHTPRLYRGHYHPPLSSSHVLVTSTQLIRLLYRSARQPTDCSFGALLNPLLSPLHDTLM